MINKASGILFFSHPTELRTHCCGLIFLLISSRGLKESASRKSTQSVVEGALSKRALSFVPTPCARFNACPPRILMAWSIVRRIYSDTDTSISLSSLPPLLSSLRSGVHLPCLHRFIFSLSLSTVCIWVRLIVSFLLDVLLVQSVCPLPLLLTSAYLPPSALSFLISSFATRFFYNLNSSLMYIEFLLGGNVHKGWGQR